jgi:hypothetical protein
MSARARLDEADATLTAALAIGTTDPSEDPDEVRLNRFEGLLVALVEAQAATAEALVEANEHRQLAFRVEYPGEDSLRHAGTPTRPYAGD